MVTVRNAPRQARFEVRAGATHRSFALREGRARVVFPLGDTWAYGLAWRSSFIRLGTTMVLAKRLPIAQPFDIVEIGPWYVVTDRLASAVYRVDRASGNWRRIATVPEARELEVVDAGTVLVTSGGSVLSLDLITGAAAPVAEVDSVVLGIARGPGGELYVSTGDRVIRIAADGGRTTLLDGRNGIHGLTFHRNPGTGSRRLIACESYAGNVLAVDLESGRVETLASGLGNPSYAVWSGSGGPYISEFSAGRISLLGGDGVLRPIAAIPQVGPIFIAADGTILTVTLDGRLLRIDLRTGTVRPLLP